jgi:hypothetical protein
METPGCDVSPISILATGLGTLEAHELVNPGFREIVRSGFRRKFPPSSAAAHLTAGALAGRHGDR